MTKRGLWLWALIVGLLAGGAGHAEAADPVRKHWPDCGTAAANGAACLAKIDFTAADAADHLAGQSLAFWTTGTSLRIVARTAGPAPRLCCTFQDSMSPLGADSKGSLWGIEYTLPHLDESILSILLLEEDGHQGEALTYTGPRATSLPPKVAALKGHVETVEIDSPNLQEKRKVSVYVPAAPPPDGGYPVVYMADGVSVATLAPYAEKLIDDRAIASVLLVGMWAGEWKSDEGHHADRRNSEYLPSPSDDPAAYAAHEAFVLKEVMPMAEDRFHASHRAESRMTYGFSSGASWSLSFALKHPDLFHQASGFAIAAGPEDLDIDHAQGMRFYIGAGAYDAYFSKTTQADCDALKQAGGPCRFISIYSGHDMMMWITGLAGALKSAFPTSF